MVPPPPIPWMARATISIPVFLASALMRDPIQKMAIAESRIIFLPQISENFPHIGAAAAYARTSRDQQLVTLFPYNKMWYLQAPPIQV
jgi:hypothetical protein